MRIYLTLICHYFSIFTFFTEDKFLCSCRNQQQNQTLKSRETLEKNFQ